MTSFRYCLCSTVVLLQLHLDKARYTTTDLCACTWVVSVCLLRSGFYVDGQEAQRDEVCAAVAALKRAAEQFGEGAELDGISTTPDNLH